MNPNEPCEFESLCDPNIVHVAVGEFELTPAFQALLKGAPVAEKKTGRPAPVLPNEQKPQEAGNACTETGS